MKPALQEKTAEAAAIVATGENSNGRDGNVE
jgi:hypothetical protein